MEARGKLVAEGVVDGAVARDERAPLKGGGHDGDREVRLRVGAAARVAGVARVLGAVVGDGQGGGGQRGGELAAARRWREAQGGREGERE